MKIKRVMRLFAFGIALIIALAPVTFGFSEIFRGDTIILEHEKGFDISSINRLVPLGDDYYEYVEEALIKSHTVPVDKSKCREFEIVSDRTDYFKKIIENAINPTETNPIALVYRGPAGCAGCSEAVAALLKSDTLWNFNVIYVGPNENMSVQAGLRLPNVVLYAQPGGEGSVNQAFSKLKKNAHAVRNFVLKGGRYLGICMGGYMVDHNPGYNLCLNTNQYIKSPGATVKTKADTLVQVMWRGTNRWMYFQDGPYFIPKSCIEGQTILATYMNGKVAAMVQPYGNGKIGVSGPHPEADASWYAAANLTDLDGHVADLGHDLIDTLMK